MVKGFDSFKKWFQGYENGYVIIGGTACDLIMSEEDMPFRATKDIDMVLIVEALTPEFGHRLWEYIIPFKAKAWLDLTEESQFTLPDGIKRDMQRFIYIK